MAIAKAARRKHYREGRATARPFSFGGRSGGSGVSGDQVIRGRLAWGVAALCLVSGSGWLLVQAYPSELGYPFAGCIHFAVIGAVTGLYALGASLRNTERRSTGWVSLLTTCVAGVCLFALPAAALQFVGGVVPPVTGVALFCLVPVMTVVCVGYLPTLRRSSAELKTMPGLLMPGVAGMGGALLLFPINLPGSWLRGLAFGTVVAVCLVVALANIWMHRALQGTRTAPSVAAIALVCALLLGMYGLRVGWPALNAEVLAGEALRCAVIDLPVVWVTVWLMREVHPARLAARFLLAPLVTVLEGYAVARGPVPVRTIVGVALLCAGGLLLLFRREPEELPGLHLR